MSRRAKKGTGRMFQPKDNGLAVVFRFERENGRGRMAFPCFCGESVNLWVSLENNKSRASGRCPKCGDVHEYRVSREYVAEGGKPGSGK